MRLTASFQRLNSVCVFSNITQALGDSYQIWAICMNSTVNSVPRFDDFFYELSKDLATKNGLKHLIVTSNCPEFLKSPTPSILYHYFSDNRHANYHRCLAVVRKQDTTGHQIDSQIIGFGDESFSIRMHLICNDPLNAVEQRNISEKSQTILTDYLRSKILELRDYVVAMSLQTNDISSFFHKATTEGLKEFFGYEAASAFYYDYQSDCLVLAATTGIDQLKIGELRRADIRYHWNSDSWVRKCFDQGKPLSEWAPRGNELRRNTFGENVRHVRNRLFLPLDVRQRLQQRLSRSYGAESKANGRMGVLRIVNTQRNGLTNPLSCIDMHLLDHFCEYIAVLGARYVRVLSTIHDQEKATHGFVTDLSTLRLRMQLFRVEITQLIKKMSSKTTTFDPVQHAVDLEGVLTLFERDFFAVQDGMAFQLQTVAEFSDGVVGESGRAAPHCKRPYVEVVVRVLQSKDSLSRNYGRPKAKITFQEQDSAPKIFAEMPSLGVPGKTFYLALRNLVENSIKYTKRNDRPQIDFDWSVENGKFRFNVLDQGIGIAVNDEASLFREGFRARNALREATRGNGLGLCVSKRGLQVYGGDLIYIGTGKFGKGAGFQIIAPMSI